jgi:hypothetical protein
MTLPASGQIAVGDVSTEIGQAATFSTDLNFLYGLIRSDQRPANPSMTVGGEREEVRVHSAAAEGVCCLPF